MNRCRGITTLEASLALMLLFTMAFTGFAVVNAVRETFRVAAINEKVLTSHSTKPLRIKLTPTGVVETELNSSELSQLLNSISQAAIAELGLNEQDYFFEVAYAVAEIDPVSGALQRVISPSNAQRITSGTYAPGEEILSKSSLEDRMSHLFSASRQAPLGDGTTVNAPLYATLVGIREGEQGEQKFVNRSVLIASRLVCRIGDSYTRSVWKQVTGQEAVFSVHAFVLRGQFT